MSDYTGVDWSTFEPKDCYFLLTSLMHSLGCMLYQSNANATWYIISINDVAVADLITDGSFSIDGSIFGQPYEYWTITGDVINSETGGINGSQCPRIRGDNTANVLQTISISNIDYIVGFWAQNDNNISPPAFVRVEINGTEVYSTAIANGFNYYEFEYPSSISGSYDLQFFNNNDDSAGYMSLDNVTFKAKYIDGKLYDTDLLHSDLPVSMAMFLNYWDDMYPLALAAEKQIKNGNNNSVLGLTINEAELLAPVPCLIEKGKLLVE